MDQPVDRGDQSAFPAVTGYCPQPGLSKREWYAGQAMAALARLHIEDWDEAKADKFAKKFFMMADAMLRESAKKEQG